jgi:hypothetical protein
VRGSLPSPPPYVRRPQTVFSRAVER